MADATSMPPKLVAYWVHGEGAAKIQWNTDGDFARCVLAITEATKGSISKRVVEGTCSNLHVVATGGRPGHGSAEHKG